MELILVRHAEPIEAVAGDGLGGDPPLSARGRIQAARVADWVGGEEVDCILSSPARRARETAGPTALRAGVEVTIEDRLRDAGDESDHYVPIELDRARDPETYRARVDAYRNSSRLDAIAARVNAALDEWTAKTRGGRVVAFCHGSVVNVFAAGVLGLPNAAFLAAGYASGHRFLISSSGIRSVQSLNETAYLID